MQIENDVDINDFKINKKTKFEDNTILSKLNSQKLYLILEHANIELTKNKKNPELINSDDHIQLIKKMGKNLEDYRPDVLYQCLLFLFNSPLNLSGKLQVFIHTKENILIELNPKLKIPKTNKRFNALITQCLNNMRIRAKNSSEILMKVIKNPVTNYLPLGCKIISTNEKSRLIKLDNYLKNDLNLNENNSESVCFVVGAMSKGDLNINYNTDSVSISSFPLTAGIVCAKILNSFEKNWNII